MMIIQLGKHYAISTQKKARYNIYTNSSVII